jgi:dolichol-phosphate mannosyltransferase
VALAGFPLVIIPTYNERANLEPVVAAVLAQGEEFRVLVVDDNSPDGTGALADQLAAGQPRVSVLHRAGRQGLGRAYLAGFQRGLEEGAEYIFEMDADLSHDPADLPRLLAPVRGGRADLVIGSRYVPGGATRGWPARRWLLSRGGSIYARSILGLPVHDPTSGFRCFHRRVLESLPLATVQGRGYVFQVEMTYRVLQAGFRVLEVPIVFTERREGPSKMSTREVVEAVTALWRLRLTARHS